MPQQKYKYNFFHSCVSEKTYVEKSEMTIIHYSKFPQPLSESSVRIRNVQCFLTNLIYIVGWWNSPENHNVENSSLSAIKTALLFTGANTAANFSSSPGEKSSRVCGTGREATSQRQVGQDHHKHFPSIQMKPPNKIHNKLMNEKYHTGYSELKEDEESRISWISIS